MHTIEFVFVYGHYGIRVSHTLFRPDWYPTSDFAWFIHNCVPNHCGDSNDERKAGRYTLPIPSDLSNSAVVIMKKSN